MGENTSEAVSKEKKSRFKNLKAEFKKIIWPGRKKAVKQRRQRLAEACVGFAPALHTAPCGQARLQSPQRMHSGLLGVR